MINGKKVVAVIQARMSSARLPGKALMPLAGKPVIAHMVDRHRRSKYIDEVVVATTTNSEDDALADWCKAEGCHCYRGSEDDVLLRIVEAAKKYGADIVVQGMADSPLFDWRYVDTLIQMLADGDCDCASNELEDTFPVGFDSRVFLFSTLEKSEALARGAAYREHASQYVYKHPGEFKLANLKAPAEVAWPALRVTLDTPEDYQLICAIYNELYPKNADFSSVDVVRFVRSHPEMAEINSAVEQVVPNLPESAAQ